MKCRHNDNLSEDLRIIQSSDVLRVDSSVKSLSSKLIDSSTLCVAKMSEKEKQKDESDVERKNIHYSLLNFTENMLETENFDDVFRSYPVTEDTKCGFGPFQGSWLQM